jgi:hypothetical protein
VTFLVAYYNPGTFKSGAKGPFGATARDSDNAFEVGGGGDGSFELSLASHPSR